MAKFSEEEIALWRKAREIAKENYEEENGGSWEDADKYEVEDYVWAAYNKLRGIKE